MNHDPRKAIRQAMMIARREVTAPSKASIGGQRHMLAYITPYEAELLMKRGGSGRLTEYGVPAFDDGDGPGGGNSDNANSNSEASTQDAAGGNAGEGAGPTGAGAGATGETGPDDTDASVSANPTAVSTPTAPTATAPFGTQGFGQAPSALGMGMIGTIGGLATGVPGLGAIGTAIGTGLDVEGLNSQLGMMGLPENISYEQALAHNMSLGMFGKSATDQFGQTLGYDALAEAPMSAFSAPQGLPDAPPDTSGGPSVVPIIRQPQQNPMEDAEMAQQQALMASSNPMQQPLMLASGGAAMDGMDPRSLPGIHLKTDHRFADGGGVQPEEEEGFDAYHGSPHEFERFDSSKIGTGEGAQAFGYGHYLAENEGVARQYRNKLAPTTLVTQSGAKHAYSSSAADEIAGDLLKGASPQIRYPVEHALGLMMRGSALDSAISKMRNDYDHFDPKNLDEAERLLRQHNPDPISSGHMYQVRVKAKPEHFLDWDAPLSEQHPQVVQALDQTFPSAMDYWRSVEGKAGDNGGHFHAVVAEDLSGSTKKGHEQIAAKLQAVGIPGIKYFDRDSRDEGKGTRNYVIFDPNMIQVKRRYADGGQIMPQRDLGADPAVQQALDITRQAQPTAPQLARQAMQSPKLASTFQAENRPSVIVSPRPGKVGGPPVQREMLEGLPEDFTQEREPWSFATPNIIGASQPPPIQHPVFNEPRMEKITNATRQIFRNKEFHSLVNDLTGLKGLTVTPTVGTWMNEMEPSFILSHPDMTDEHARTLAHLLGFGFQQDATVQVKHNSNAEEGIPAMLAGSGKKLTAGQIDAIHHEATKHGMDFTITGDGKAAKFLHFGDETDLPSFMDKVQSISNAANLPELYTARTAGDLIDAQAYLNGIFRGAGSPEGDQTSTGRSPDLFRRVVDHVLAPYAKAVAGEGYRLSPERLAQTYALNDDEREHVRGALYPGKKDDRTTVPLMTGEEQLDVRPTGERGRASVGDVLYALQNRAAAKGQIDPGDFSDNAKKDIAQNIAREVAYHVQNSDKSAIGWYDDALKGAMSQYSARFPELETDPQKLMLFHALLGITSQGNDVYSNSIHAMRLYDQVRSGEKSLPEAVNNLKGSFGDKTRAIESNLLKFHHLLENNGYDRMSDLFNQTKTVGEWNKILREDKSLRGPGDDQLKMQGGANQKVTGWMVFGPKIGSFINNLHGDYSTLTADLWFSRTWNRLLGHNFIHTPLAEAKQYRDFRDALRAEYYSSNPNVGVGPIPKTEDGKLVLTKKGQPEPWEYGNDAPALSKEEFDDLLNDPDKMLGFAQDVTKRYRDSQFKDKSDLRRRAKNWIENRELPVAAPRGDLERQFQQNTVEEAQKLLKKKYGMDISVADIQAALWFHEKELFGKLGVASEKAQPADYADAARRTMQLIDSGELYRVKSKEKGKKVKPQEEFASGGTTMPMRDSAVVERALRLTSANRPMVALADLFQRQLRGRPPS